MATMPALRFDIVANDRTAAEFAKIKSAMDQMAQRIGTGNQQAQKAFQATAGQARTLGLQLSDITGDLLSGRSPLDVIANQGLRVATLLGNSGASSVGGAFRSLRESVVSLVNPVSLLATGFLALGGLAISWLSKAFKGTEDLAAITERHTESVKLLREAYGEAEAAQEGMTEAFRLDRLTRLPTEIRAAADAIAREMSALEDRLVRGRLAHNDLGDGPINTLELIINDFLATLRAGNADVDAFRAIITGLAAATDDLELDRIVIDLLGWSDALLTNTQLVAGLRDELAFLQGEIGAGTTIGVGEVTDDLAGVTDEAKRAREQFDTFAAAFRAMDDTARPALTEMEQLTLAYGKAMGSAADETQRAAAQLSFLEAQGRILDQARDNVVNFIGGLQREIDLLGMGDLEAAIARNVATAAGMLPEGEVLNPEQIAAIEAATTAITNLNQARRGAGGGGGGGAVRAEADAVADLIAQLEHEQALIGMSAEDQAVMNALRRAGADATDEQRLAIEGLVRENFELEAAEREAADRLEEMKSAAMDVGSAIIDAFSDGKLEAEEFLDILKDVVKQLLNALLRMAIDFIAGGIGGGGGGISGKAGGGPVEAGVPYLVGERGMEIFVPPVAGRIVPNHQLGRGAGAGGPANIRIEVHTDQPQRAEQGPTRMNGEEMVIGLVLKTIGSGRADGVLRGRFGARPSRVHGA